MNINMSKMERMMKMKNYVTADHFSKGNGRLHHDLSNEEESGK